VQKLIQSARKAIAEFIEQRDDLIMLLSCGDNDCAVLLKLFRDAEQGNDTDVFLLFADDFVAAEPYVSVIGERLRVEHRIASEAAIEAGKSPFPPIPDVIFDPQQHPSYRLYKAAAYTRSLLPSAGGHRLIWVLCPQKIMDRREYLSLLSPFVPREGVQPWMSGLRLVFRDQPDTVAYAPEIASADRVRPVSFDTSPAAIEASFQAEATDSSLPLDQRLQALLQLALMDTAHSRIEPAVEKYRLLLGHYQEGRDAVMQAVVLNGLGDVSQRAGDLIKARHWYESAVSMAGESKNAAVLSTILRNLANLSFAEGDYNSAEQYFVGLDQLYAHMLSPESKIEALIWCGVCQQQQSKLPEAISSWEAASTLGRSIGLPQLQMQALGLLSRAYGDLGLTEQLVAAQTELKSLQPPEVH
jgi:tetratricopeptide (TPR) repeat protein